MQCVLPTEADVVFPPFLLVMANCVFALFLLYPPSYRYSIAVFDALTTRGNCLQIFSAVVQTVLLTM